MNARILVSAPAQCGGRSAMAKACRSCLAESQKPRPLVVSLIRPRYMSAVM